jgi:hypothetical protein
MPKKMRQAGALLAIAGMMMSTAAQAQRSCASAAEVSAIQVAAVNQELTDAALACGPVAVANYNRFARTFQRELRRSDGVLLTMFKRVHGPARGNREYDAFKTRAISNADNRRTKPGAHDGFCAAANIVFDAALAPDKPVLEDFVSGVPIVEKHPVDACEIRVAMTLQGVKTGSDIAPTPRPARPGDPAEGAAAAATPAVQ